MARPVLALVTDFGTRDHYVGAMKGVILGICPDATLVDITHDVPAHDVFAGAIELLAVYRYFPRRTVFVGVVDPGVGSGRRALAAEAGELQFVGPDNGLFAPIFQESPPARLVELTEARYRRTVVSRTFEGRDRFAPAAAWLATGVELSLLGPSLDGYEQLHLPRATIDRGGITGTVLRVDRFGNLVTNIGREDFRRADLSDRSDATIEVGDREVRGIVTTYAAKNRGEVCALFGSTDCLEIAARDASAAETIGVGRGAAVHVKRSAW